MKLYRPALVLVLCLICSSTLGVEPHQVISLPGRYGADAEFGETVAPILDRTGDGIPELLIGASQAVQASSLTEGFAFLFDPTQEDPELALRGFRVGVPIPRFYGRRIVRAGNFDDEAGEDVAIAPRNGIDSNRVDVYNDLFLGSIDEHVDIILTAPDYPTMARSLAAGWDLNADGFDDIVAGTFSTADEGEPLAYVFLGGAPPATTPSLAFPAPPGGRIRNDVALAEDLNGDGHPDVIIGSLTHVQVHFGGPGLDDVADLDFPVPASVANDVQVAATDVDGDGASDLLLTDRSLGPPWSLLVYRGGAAFDTVADFVFADVYSAHPVGDVSGDGYADVLALLGSGLAAVFHGGPSFDTIPDALFRAPGQIGGAAGADLTGDGIRDLIIGSPTAEVVVAYTEIFHDCDDNDVPDAVDIANGLLDDCDGNGFGDACDIALLPSLDCDANGVIDACEPSFPGADCNNNGLPDECETDCDANGIPDDCDIASDPSRDCNGDSVLDTCQLSTPFDCDQNGEIDSCELAQDPSLDCESNGILDACQITGDCDLNGVPDVCELAADPALDCDASGTLDLCEIQNDPLLDCDTSGDLDRCQLAAVPPADCNFSGVLDTCEALPDADQDGIPDICDQPVSAGVYFDPGLTQSEAFGVSEEPITVYVGLRFSAPFEAATVSGFDLSLDLPPNLVGFGSLAIPGTRSYTPELHDWSVVFDTPQTVTNGTLVVLEYTLVHLPPFENTVVRVIPSLAGTELTGNPVAAWYDDLGQQHPTGNLVPAWIERTVEDCNWSGVDDLTEIEFGFLVDANQNQVPDICEPVAVDEVVEPGFHLQAPWPNPFNPRTRIVFRIPEGGRVELAIYDVQGRRVRSLLSDLRPAGAHEVSWLGQDEQGRPVGSGVYLARVRWAGREISRKMILVR